VGETEELFQAIQSGAATRVASLLDAQPELLEAHDAGGNSPLLIALYYGEPEIAAALVLRGCPVNLWEAAALGDLPRLHRHVDAGPADVRALSHDGWTPLHLAAHFGHAKAVQFLISRGADVHARSTNDLANAPLHAALAGRSLECARALLDAGADPNAVEHGGFAPLHQAAETGDLGLIRLLLERGAHKHVLDDEGRRPRDLAAAKDHAEAAQLLS
jgi:uncharacterized protein